MFRLNILVSFRNMKKSFLFTSINVIGLGIGLFACLLIFEYLQNEWTYDTFHKDYKSTYRVTHDILGEESIMETATTFSKVASELNQSHPVISEVCRILKVRGDVAVSHQDKLFREERLLGADSTFFDIFNFEFIYGSPDFALVPARSVVITKAIAEKYFGAEDPLGQELTMDGAFGIWGSNGYNQHLTYTVTGVIKDLPVNTHLAFDFLISFNLYPALERELSNWGDSFYTYFSIEDPAGLNQIEAGLIGIGEKYKPDQGVVLGAQKMQEIHLTSNRINEIKPNGSEKITWLLAAVAVIMLIIAGTNYINFTTARAVSRQKEVAIRKVFWAKPSQLFGQLLTEAFLFNFVALLFAFLLIAMSQPFLPDLFGFDLMRSFSKPHFWLLSLVVLIVATLIAGVYPSIFISQLKLEGGIHGSVSQGFSQGNVRKTLLAFQFAISVLVIGFAIILYNQMRFVDQKELGITIENTIAMVGPSVGIDNDSIYDARLSIFKTEVLTQPNVEAITLANFIPGKEIRGEARGYVRRIGEPEEQASSYYFSQIDYDFLVNFKTKVIAGRYFESQRSTDRQSIVINREAARQLGFSSPEAAIGEKIIYRRNSNPTIIGVIDNFHQYSLRRDFQPIILEVQNSPDRYCYLKFSSTNDLSDLIKVQESWDELFPGNPFTYFFLDEFYANQYEADNRFMTVFGIFSLLAVLIAGLGIFGLAYFTATNRMKEIGIRKSLGAGFWDIYKLISKKLGLYVVVAGVVSVPMIYLLAENWLQNYSFRIEIAAWMLFAPVCLLIVIAMLVVSVQCLKTHKLDPVETLRSE